MKRFITQPPRFYRMLFPRAVWRLHAGPEKVVYLTFDDGPIPEVTPWVLDLLDRMEVKATFFMVGENVMRHPELLDMVRRRGHAVGNHTMRHLQGLRAPTQAYLSDIARADALIGSRLFRPPHGIMRPAQTRAINEKMQIVMYDVVTRDYSRTLTPAQVVENVKRYTRPGSIIVFHDSLKSFPRLRHALPEAIDWLKSQGYTFRILPGEALGFRRR